MSKTNEAISNALDIETNIIATETKNEIAIIEPLKQVNPNDIIDDYHFSRNTFYNLIQKGEKALDNLVDIAKESETARSYEVLATMIKTISETTRDLYDLQKKKKEMLEETKQSTEQNIVVDKAVFFGTTSELLKKIKNNETIE